MCPASPPTAVQARTAEWRFSGAVVASTSVPPRCVCSAGPAPTHSEAPEAPIIAFPRGAGAALAKFAGVEGIAAIGLDTTVEASSAAAALPGKLASQGNLDPLALLAGGDSLDESVERILAGFSGRPHIFNLGHGILPETPIAHVEQLVARVRRAR